MGKLRALEDIACFHVDNRKYDLRYENTVSSVLTMNGLVTKKDFCERAEEALVKFPRMRSRILEKGTKYFFEEVEIDVADHVSEISLEGGLEASMLKFAARHMLEPINFERPLWDASILYFSEDPERCVIFLRVHHTVCDGVTMERVFNGLFDPTPENARMSVSKRKNRHGFIQRLMHIPYNMVVFADGLFEGLFLSVLPGDTVTKLKLSSAFDVSTQDRAIAVGEMPLEIVRRIKDRVGATVNDVLMTALALACAKYMKHHEDPALKGSPQIRCTFPCSTRPGGADVLSEKYFKNMFIMLCMQLPMESHDPVACLWKVKNGCEEMKHSPEAGIIYYISSFAMKYLPAVVARKSTFDLFDKMTIFFTNVQGPQTVRKLKGAEMQKATFFVPALTGACLGVNTYNGQLNISVVSDPVAVADPEVLLKAFTDGLEALDVASAVAEEQKTLRQPSTTFNTTFRFVRFLIVVAIMMSPIFLARHFLSERA